MKLNPSRFMKAETAKEFIMAVAGVILVSACVGVALYFQELLFILFIIAMMGVFPAVYAVMDTVKGRYRRSLSNFFAVMLYYYLAAWYDVLVIVLIFPAIAFSVIAGPIAFVLFIVGVVLLGTALLQWVSGSRMGLSNMCEPAALIVSTLLTAVCGGIIYLNFFRSGAPIDEIIAEKTTGAFNRFLDRLKHSAEYKDLPEQ
ncbi:MAG TPA: hypothetical protein PK544_04780 [Spirochaetota bacterium]|nr:hypothetical protein [Spirochaetota bacterium]HPJ39069.1 hypothetical protein [Spirochaetota bacterium]HPQ53124.1 hypothetical protein [Spirochaetota bacterium]